MKYQNIKHLLCKWIGKSSLFNSALYSPNHNTAGAIFSHVQCISISGCTEEGCRSNFKFIVSLLKKKPNQQQKKKPTKKEPWKSRSGYRNLFHNSVYQAVCWLTRVAAPVTSFSAEISQEKCKSNQHMFAFHLSLSSGNKIQIVSGAMKGTFWYYFQVFLSRQRGATTCISVEHIQPPSTFAS